MDVARKDERACSLRQKERLQAERRLVICIEICHGCYLSNVTPCLVM